MNQRRLKLLQRVEHNRNTAWAWAMDHYYEIIDLSARIKADDELCSKDDDVMGLLVHLVASELLFKKVGNYNPI